MHCFCTQYIVDVFIKDGCSISTRPLQQNAIICTCIQYMCACSLYTHVCTFMWVCMYTHVWQRILTRWSIKCTHIFIKENIDDKFVATCPEFMLLNLLKFTTKVLWLSHSIWYSITLWNVYAVLETYQSVYAIHAHHIIYCKTYKWKYFLG